MPRSACDPRFSDDCRLPAGNSCITTTVCGIAYDENEGIDFADLADRIAAVLAAHGVRPPRDRIESFGRTLAFYSRPRVIPRPRTSANRGARSMDILAFIGEAQRSGDRDEALWRAFLATHFADVESAGRFLCGFGAEPLWTWAPVCSDPLVFSAWLRANVAALATLRYGNHRKFESKQPDDIAAVVGSFVAWVRSRGGSVSAAFATPDSLSPTERFRALYHAFDVYRFGRLGRFDLLCLLGELDLLPVAPDSCYIEESSGPLRGARMLCGDLDRHKLGHIADDLARVLAVSPMAVEDALCVWQKHLPVYY